MGKYSLSELFQKIGIKENEIFDLAIKTNFIQRARLVTAQDILFALCSESIHGTVSYNDLASNIEATSNISVSRQAIWKKVSEPCLDFFQGILEMVILKKLGKKRIEINKEILSIQKNINTRQYYYQVTC